MRTFLRASAVAAAAGLFLAAAAGAATAAPATVTAPGPAITKIITGGDTTVTTGPGLPSLLFRKDITVLATTPATQALTGGSRLFGGVPTGPARGAGTGPALRLVFPVSGGRAGLRAVSGQVEQRGGVLFVQASSSRTVLLSGLVMDFGRRVVTAVVNGDPRVRVAVFRLDLSRAGVRAAGRTITVTGIGLAVTAAGAQALDSGLGVTVLSPGTQVGTARTVLRT